MANKKITELNEATSISGTDWLVMVDVANDETKKIHANQVGGNIPIQDTAPSDPEEDDLWIDTSEASGGSNILDTIYPIGSIIIKADNSDYSNWLGFTWERTLVGRVAVGIDSSDADFDTIDETGGSKDAVVVAHTHKARLKGLGSGSAGFDWTGASANSDYFAGGYIESTGESGTGKNLQPYQVVAYWKRTA